MSNQNREFYKAFYDLCRREHPSLSHDLVRRLSKVTSVQALAAWSQGRPVYMVETDRQCDAISPVFTTIRKFPTVGAADRWARGEASRVS